MWRCAVGYTLLPLHPEENAAIRTKNGILWSLYPWVLLCKRENLLSLPDKEIEVLDCPTPTYMKLGFVVPCFFKYSNKTPNRMQQSVVKFIAWSHRRCSTCFGHYYAHHQELFQTAVALTNRPRLETHPPRHVYGKRRLRLQFERAPDDGHNNAQNMLSRVYATKQ
jgi:hypothetical protein